MGKHAVSLGLLALAVVLLAAEAARAGRGGSTAVAPTSQQVAQQGPPGALRLRQAAVIGDTGAVRALLNSGTDVLAADPDGRTALHLAVTAGRLEIVDLLVRHVAALDARQNDGMTPLHLAVLARDVSMVERLLGAGALATIADGRGRTPRDLAAALKEAPLTAVLDRSLRERAADPETARARGAAEAYVRAVLAGDLAAARRAATPAHAAQISGGARVLTANMMVIGTECAAKRARCVVRITADRMPCPLLCELWLARDGEASKDAWLVRSCRAALE